MPKNDEYIDFNKILLNFDKQKFFLEMSVQEINSTSKEESEDENENCVEDGIRCLFDAYTATKEHIVEIESFTPTLSIPIVTAEDQDPGALQSGVYLWPASKALCEYIYLRFFKQTLTSFQDKPKQSSHTSTLSTSLSTKGLRVDSEFSYDVVVELGAGCGLGGLCYALILMNLYNTRIHQLKRSKDGETENETRSKYEENVHLKYPQIILTDRDEVLIDHMNKSIKLNSLEDLVSTHLLLWGNSKSALQQLMHLKNRVLDQKFIRQERDLPPRVLLIGSDLTYSSETIPMLFETVSLLLSVQKTNNEEKIRKKCNDCESAKSQCEVGTNVDATESIKYGHVNDNASETDTNTTSVFILVSSFRHEGSTDIIKESCLKFGLYRKVTYDTISSVGSFQDSSTSSLTTSMNAVLGKASILVEEFYLAKPRKAFTEI